MRKHPKNKIDRVKQQGDLIGIYDIITTQNYCFYNNTSFKQTD
jgi:hypothetical protein